MCFAEHSVLERPLRSKESRLVCMSAQLEALNESEQDPERVSLKWHNSVLNLNLIAAVLLAFANA